MRDVFVGILESEQRDKCCDNGGRGDDQVAIVPGKREPTDAAATLVGRNGGNIFVSRNLPAGAARAAPNRASYRWANLNPSAPENMLVIVTASGGGTRATALTLSVLRGLDRILLPDGSTLAQKVDVLSSVSGGSVAAGYFALKGRDGLDTLERAVDFFHPSDVFVLDGITRFRIDQQRPPWALVSPALQCR